MIVHLIDGTYELFRHFYGIRRFAKGDDPPFGAVAGVLDTVVQMIEDGRDAHRRGDGSRDRIVSQRSLAGVQDRRRASIPRCGAVSSARGGARGDGRGGLADGRAGSGRRAGLGGAPRGRAMRDVEKVCIWTPDKDLAQCVRDDRVVQVDRKSGQIRDAAGVRAKFGVTPALIPDYLALVGDAADGYPGIRGIGAKTAAA